MLSFKYQELRESRAEKRKRKILVDSLLSNSQSSDSEPETFTSEQTASSSTSLTGEGIHVGIQVEAIKGK